MRTRMVLVLCAALALAVGVATATGANPTITIDGHFTETNPKVQAPHLCFNGDFGSGWLKGFGKACEQFTFESFDGFDADGCFLFTGTVTFMLDDAQHSSFTEREQDASCQPGNSPQEEGHNFSFGNPTRDRGKWHFLSGTGVFANVCAGSGDVRFHSGGAAFNGFYTGLLTLC